MTTTLDRPLPQPGPGPVPPTTAAGSPLVAPPRRGRSRLRRLGHALRPTEMRVVFLLALAAYLTLGAYELIVNAVDFGDAASRLYQAHAVTLSRDPHLGAIGFVFGPLPGLALIPFTWLGTIFPVLLSRGYLIAIESALASAGSCAVLVGLFRDLRVPRLVRLGLVATFAVHPVIAYYAGSGMSEPMEIFLLLVATRATSRWLLGDGGNGALLTAGLACGGAYLTRLESLGSGLAVSGLVVVVSFLRTRGGLRRRRATALTDLALVGGPFLFLAALWAVATKVIIGVWIGYVSSSYGNIAQVGNAKEDILDRVGRTVPERLAYLSHQVLGLEPLVVLIVAAALASVVVRRDLRPLAPIATFGATLAATSLAFLKGDTFGWVRFSITVIPLSVCLAGALASRLPLPTGRGPRSRKVRAASLFAATLGGAVGLAALVPAIPASIQLVQERRYAPQEAPTYYALVEPDQATKQDRFSVRAGDTERRVARDLDAMGLPRGSVLTDTGTSFDVVLGSQHPEQFVVTADRDFQRSVADPAQFDVRYALVPKPSGAFDAVLATYPDMYATGHGQAELVGEWEESGNGHSWRLWRLSDRFQGAGAVTQFR